MPFQSEKVANSLLEPPLDPLDEGILPVGGIERVLNKLHEVEFPLPGRNWGVSFSLDSWCMSLKYLIKDELHQEMWVLHRFASVATTIREEVKKQGARLIGVGGSMGIGDAAREHTLTFKFGLESQHPERDIQKHFDLFTDLTPREVREIHHNWTGETCQTKLYRILSHELYHSLQFKKLPANQKPSEILGRIKSRGSGGHHIGTRGNLSHTATAYLDQPVEIGAYAASTAMQLKKSGVGVRAVANTNQLREWMKKLSLKSEYRFYIAQDTDRKKRFLTQVYKHLVPG